jgi:hypothetical protein
MLSRTCADCGQQFTVDDGDLAFYEKLSPAIDGKRLLLSPPKRCPKCRLQRRLAYRNQVYVYVRKSSKSGKSIFSMYPEEVPFPVYSRDEWWSDVWDSAAYGREFDFSREFFPQFLSLKNEVPQFPLASLNPENSDYCNNVTGVKNCYLVFNTSHAEECIYCENVFKSRDCLDCTHTPSSELCFDCVQCSNCYAVQSSAYCDNCSDSYFLLHCQGCRNCFGCANLRRKEYCIYNKEYSKEEYQQFLSRLDLSSWQTRQHCENQASEFFRTQPRPHIESRMTENVTGNVLFEAKNVFDSYLVRGAENARYVFNAVHGVKDCYDYSCFGNGAELLYECMCCGSKCFSCRFCFLCWDGAADLTYCWGCIGCRDCFGCVGLTKKQYVILNKQYSKAEYNRLVPKIVEHMQNTGEWGEFYPADHSPVPYNQSYAQRLFPLTKEETAKRGWWWYDKEALKSEQALDAAALPDGLPASNDPIVARSALSGRPYRITGEEIKRYRKLRVPLPRLCYDERMEQRVKLLGGVELFERACARTGKILLTTFPPSVPWTIWDREEYDREFS